MRKVSALQTKQRARRTQDELLIPREYLNDSHINNWLRTSYNRSYNIAPTASQSLPADLRRAPFSARSNAHFIARLPHAGITACAVHRSAQKYNRLDTGVARGSRSRGLSKMLPRERGHGKYFALIFLETTKGALTFLAFILWGRLTICRVFSLYIRFSSLYLQGGPKNFTPNSRL